MKKKRTTPRTALLGDLIAQAFDEASRHSTDPTEVARLAVRAVVNMLRRIGDDESEPKQTARIDPASPPESRSESKATRRSN